jgi:hypothetical protein
MGLGTVQPKPQRIAADTERAGEARADRAGRHGRMISASSPPPQPADRRREVDAERDHEHAGHHDYEHDVGNGGDTAIYTEQYRPWR